MLPWPTQRPSAALKRRLASARGVATAVGVVIVIGQPGVLGRIDTGRFPQPQVIVQQPMVTVCPQHQLPPVSLHVPAGHRKGWRRRCGPCDACGTPAYFVQEGWHQDHVVHGEPLRGGRDDRRGDRSDDRHGDRSHCRSYD